MAYAAAALPQPPTGGANMAIEQTWPASRSFDWHSKQIEEIDAAIDRTTPRSWRDTRYLIGLFVLRGQHADATTIAFNAKYGIQTHRARIGQCNRTQRISSNQHGY
jgi:hypothetical protein